MIKELLNEKNINCINIEEKLKTKNDVLELLGMGTFGVAFFGCLDKLCDTKVGVKFLTMKKKYNIDNTHPGIVEVLVGKKLSEFVTNNLTPHINCVFRGFTCNIDKLKGLRTITKSDWYNNRIYDKYKEKYYDEFNQKYYKDIMIIFNEIADGDFKKYFKEREEEKNPLSFDEQLNVFFCFCYTMVVIVHTLKNYRHNDIKPNNLLYKLVSQEDYNKNNVIEYKIFNKSFYLPQLKFVIKLHDFDYSNCDLYPNKKITNFSGLFKEINATPFTNPVYDLHEYINFYLRDFGKYIKGSKFDTFLKSLLTEDTLGEESLHTRRYKLTNFKVNVEREDIKDEERYNYIPPTMKTPAELILTCKEFKIFTKLNPKNKIIETYDSKILHPKSDNKLKKRNDLFNVSLN